MGLTMTQSRPQIGSVRQQFAGVPADKDAPTKAKIYTASDAPVGLTFADEDYWSTIYDRLSKIVTFSDSNGPAVSKTQIAAAAQAMKGRRGLNGPKVNVYYIANSQNSPQQFIEDASKKGYGSINLYFGHGNLKKSTFDWPSALGKLQNPKGLPAPRFGIGGCYADELNSEIPQENQLPVYPKNDNTIMAGTAPQWWTPMINSVDSMIKDRVKAGQTVELNLYFGELRMNTYQPDNTFRFKSWNPHPNRYGNWK